jgi:hypothetical protein
MDIDEPPTGKSSNVIDGSNMDVDGPAGDEEQKVNNPSAPQSVIDLSDLSDYEEPDNDQPPAQRTIDLTDDKVESPPKANQAIIGTLFPICTHSHADIADEWEPDNSSLGVDINSQVVHIDKEGRPYTQRIILLP